MREKEIYQESITITGIRYEDFTNYYKPSMFISFPYCTFKCEKECGEKMCQNSILATSKHIIIQIEDIINKYLLNTITESVVCGGLEPFDSWNALKNFIRMFRMYTDDDIVIYTGYYENELKEQIKYLKQYKNIIVKFGRYIPNKQKCYDEVLKIYLASNNQYAVKIS